ncbi:unnamed protein product [Fusarium graminearum]|nr:unnamed protein product [Fusarium graminearum]
MILSFIQKVAGPCFHQNIMRLVRVWVLKARIANGSPFLPTQDIQGFISDAETTLPESQILEQLNTNDTPNSDNLNATIDLVKIPEGLENSEPKLIVNDDTRRDRNSGLSWSYFARILHLEAVFEETLRCGGATSSLQHLSKIDTQILGYHIPKGTDVLFLAHGPSVFTPGFEIDESKRSQTCQAAGEKRDQDWDDHDIGAFKPERWLGQKESYNRGGGGIDTSAGPSLAFGTGTRGCFGKILGCQQLKTSISILILNFELLPYPEEFSSYSTIEVLTSMPDHSYIRLAKID